MADDMFSSGVHEHAKALVHLAVIVPVSMCFGYNVMAWLGRRQPHLAINAVIYALALVWEGSHVAHHLRQRS